MQEKQPYTEWLDEINAIDPLRSRITSDWKYGALETYWERGIRAKDMVLALIYANKMVFLIGCLC